MIALLALLAAVPATAPATNPTSSTDTIVVTGVSLRSLADAVDRCKATPCPPREDIVASIRYAEGLFRTGSYVKARSVLAGSVSRTRHAAKAEPVALSELYLAEATVAAHEGEQRIVQRATFARAAVLHDNLPADAPATLLADMGVGDWQLRTGTPARAGTVYQRVAARARAAGRPDIAAAATLRLATIAHAGRHDDEADRLLAGLATADGAELAGFRFAARALAARFARERGDEGATEALLAALAREPQRAAPVLLWAPEMPRPTDAVPNDPFELRRDTVTRSSDIAGLQWADIGFLIRPDGTVETPELLRGSPGEGWAAPLLAAIAQRRYAPYGGGAGAEAGGGQYRVERFTATADYDTPAGSLIRRRVRNPRYERLDITGGAPAARIAPTAG